MDECIINLEKENFLQRFLIPVSKLTDNAVITIIDDEVNSVCASTDGSVVLLASLKLTNGSCNNARLNLPDVKKFIRLLDCIEENNILLEFKNNHLRHNTSNFKFNYHLFEDSYMQRCPVNQDKIKALKYDSTFLLTTNKFNDILKASSIATDSDKLYFYTRDNEVYAELNDYERQNINSITYKISDKFVGEPIKNVLPLNLESIRLLSGLKADTFVVKINNALKVTLFEIISDNINIKFVISALVK